MTRAAAILACFIFVQATGQTLNLGKADSALREVDESRSKLIDSLGAFASVNRYRDSLRIVAWADRLKSSVNLKYDLSAISSFADTLRGKGLPEDSMTYQTPIASHLPRIRAFRMDSFLEVKERLLNEVNEKQSTLHEKVARRYSKWTESLRRQFNLDSAGARLLGLPALGNPMSLTDPSLPPAPLPATDIATTQIPALETEDFSSLGISPDLNAVAGDMAIPDAQQLRAIDASVPRIPDQMKEINGQLVGVKSLKDNPTDAMEKAAGGVAEVKQATSGLSEAEAMKQQSETLRMAEQMNSPEAGAVRMEAVNHLSGQEKTLQATINKMAKYKKKYSSIGSLSEIPKNDWLPRNGLKGNPFKERFRAGMNLGYQGIGDTLIFDFYPNASYRVTGRIEAGLGAVYRMRVVSEPLGLDQRNPVWGISSFVLLKTFKSVHLRCEVDGNSFPVSGSTDRDSYRDWRWSFFTGIQTNFKISKKWTGNVQMLYNFDSSLKDGFPEKLAARTGVQYQLK